MANKMVFINLPVTDIKRATSFYEALGFVKNEEFSNETSSGLVWSESIWLMLLEHAFYQQFLNGRSIADTKKTSGALIAFSFDTPEEAKNFDFKATLSADGDVTIAQDNVHYLYSGFTSKWKIYSSTTTPPTEPGSYVMTVVTLGGNYQAAPITRGFKITK